MNRRTRARWLAAISTVLVLALVAVFALIRNLS
jgi:hypothetical protein